MKLSEFNGKGVGPEYNILRDIILNYRKFVGNNAAFHIEYDFWPGKFETKDEEMDFHLNEFARPDDYEVVAQWHEEAVYELSACEVELIDTRSSRNFWRVAAIVLLIPYLVFWYFWQSNT